MPSRVAIVGAGLAGTTLAWQFKRHGVSTVLFDCQMAGAASPVAAGLITPVTGLRLAKSWQFERLWPSAVEFYRSIETELGRSFFFEHMALRLFQNDDERRLCEAKSIALGDHAIGAFAADPGLVNPALHQPFGAIGFAPAGHLKVGEFLKLSRSIFDVRNEEVVPERIEDHGHGLRVNGEDYQSLVFCQGFAGAGNPWFPDLKFNLTKGEILTFSIPGLDEIRTIHAAGWLSRRDQELYLAGSTYERVDLSPRPTDMGKAEVIRKIGSMVRVPFAVVDHRCGIRPTIRESQPTMMPSSLCPRIWCFNGLGSKGSLVAPAFAGELARIVTDSIH